MAKKENKIILPTRFEVHENGLSGHILFSDGSVGKCVDCKINAWRQMTQALLDGKVCNEEMRVLVKQISASSLPWARISIHHLSKPKPAQQSHLSPLEKIETSLN